MGGLRKRKLTLKTTVKKTPKTLKTATVVQTPKKNTGVIGSMVQKTTKPASKGKYSAAAPKPKPSARGKVLPALKPGMNLKKGKKK